MGSMPLSMRGDSLAMYFPFFSSFLLPYICDLFSQTLYSSGPKYWDGGERNEQQRRGLTQTEINNIAF